MNCFFKNLVYLIILSFILCSCNKDENTVKDDNDKNKENEIVYDPTNIYRDETSLLLSLDSIYGILRDGEKVQRTDFYSTVTTGDAMVGGEAGGNDLPPLQDMMKFTVISNNIQITNYWTSMFRGISMANNFIINASASVDSGYINENLFERTKGEALFLKGLYYFKLTSMFCGYPQMQANFGSMQGLPMIDGPFNYDSIVFERPSLDSTWSKIFEYFLAASELLPEKSEYSSNDNGRASKGAAKSLLAKSYIFTEHWEEGLTYAEDVIKSEKYGLVGEDDTEYKVTRVLPGNITSEITVPPLKWLFLTEADNCTESIFEIQHTREGGGYFGKGNHIINYYGPRWYFDPVTNESLNYGKWGFICPTDFFIYSWKEPYVNEKPLDSRFNLFIIDENTLIPNPVPGEVDVYPDTWASSPTGRFTWKYLVDPYNRPDDFWDYEINTKVMRYADLILLAAEAAYMDGQASKALSYVNMITTRARKSGTTGYPEDYTSITREDILYERRIELCFEGERFYDMIRTGTADDILQNATPVYGNHGIFSYQQQFGFNFIEGKSEIMPIPMYAIDLSGGKLVQNPGY